MDEEGRVAVEWDLEELRTGDRVAVLQGQFNSCVPSSVPFLSWCGDSLLFAKGETADFGTGGTMQVAGIEDVACAVRFVLVRRWRVLGDPDCGA